MPKKPSSLGPASFLTEWLTNHHNYFLTYLTARG